MWCNNFMSCFFQPVCIWKHEKQNALLYLGLPKQHRIMSEELWQVGVSQGSDKNHILTEVWVCSFQRPKTQQKKLSLLYKWYAVLENLVTLLSVFFKTGCQSNSQFQVSFCSYTLMCLVTFNFLFLSLSCLSTCVWIANHSCVFMPVFSPHPLSVHLFSFSFPAPVMHLLRSLFASHCFVLRVPACIPGASMVCSVFSFCTFVLH